MGVVPHGADLAGLRASRAKYQTLPGLLGSVRVGLARRVWWSSAGGTGRVGGAARVLLRDRAGAGNRRGPERFRDLPVVKYVGLVSQGMS